ncbi:concanavalin A-like lectin/glucanase [Hyaloscypha variabilis F]|uniref:Concanavalin A-like lectin/glucanase n=1 Tax=Hyaloscypha variabilis (strain UAMH 11265 / GT02V1 / F) TaxID=1149755 RepID=A0A2J6QTS3_HYAVF|nr:concanavalin A-like lectin/glucanase [Hyaloscypha variabilis F]
MHFSTLLSAALFSTVILAAPKGHGLASRVAHRQSSRASGLLDVKYSKDVVDPETGNVTHIDYSSNWAGGVVTSPPAGETFSYIQGQFVVPTPSFPAGSAAFWVGIDGDTYGNAILQAGVDVTINSDGSTSFDSWYEWYPQYSITFDPSQFSFGAGDTIFVSVQSITSTDGTVTLQNLSTGQSVTQDVSAPDSSSALGGQNAEWIVEDFDENGSQVAFTDFGSVSFTNALAQTAQGSTLGTDGADIIEIVDDNNNVITQVSIPNSAEVDVVYSG